MRRYFFLLLFLMTCLQGFAQKLTAIDYDYTNKRIAFPSLRPHLTRDDHYSINLPLSLSYHRSTAEIQAGIWDPFTSFIPIPARIHMARPDFQIDVLAPGLSNFSGGGARWIETQVRDADGINFHRVKGYVRDFTASFPCVLRIRNKEGKTLDSISIAEKGERFTITMHRDLLLTTNRPENLAAENPYFSEKELMDAETMYRDALAKKAEQIIAYRTFQRLVQVVGYLYNDFNSGKQLYGWGFVKAKNRVADYSDLDASVTEYRRALDSMDKGRYDTCQLICRGLKQKYLSVLGSGEERVDKNVREVLYYNLSHVSLLLDEYEDAWKYYRLFVGGGKVSEGSRMAEELRGRINMLQFRDNLAKTTRPS